jgi:hypothetical protein
MTVMKKMMTAMSMRVQGMPVRMTAVMRSASSELPGDKLSRSSEHLSNQDSSSVQLASFWSATGSSSRWAGAVYSVAGWLYFQA